MATPSAEEPLPPPVAGGGSSLDFPVVGIGTSAGGVKALLTFFEHMPSGSGMAFVVVIHLSPDHSSSIDEILRAATRMPVTQVRDTTRIERDHVYVIPPNKHLAVRDGVLELTPFERSHGSATSIDAFFRSLAAAHKERAIAIVLTGSGSDGSVGLKNIREAGGVTLAQTPDDAEYDAMPCNAIATGVVDFVLPIEKMAERLVQLWQNMQQIRRPAVHDADVPLTPAPSYEEPLRDILAVLRQRTGRDFGSYKRATVLRRVERRLQVTQLADLAAYADYLRAHPAETPLLLKDMLISVTNFFRDPEAFEALERSALAHLFADKGQDDEVRVWVAGCATGEEAYSLAMLLTEIAEERSVAPPIQVFATDIDEDALAVARAGLYPDAIATDLPAGRLHRFFSREADGYRVQKSIRECVMFAVHDMLRDAPFSRLDLVSCRNVLIYLKRDAQARLLATFHFALRQGGYLFLGSSESVEEPAAFTMVDKTHRILRPQPHARRAPAVLYVPGDTVSSRAGNPGGPTRSENAKRHTGLGDLHLNLLEHYAPPSVVVNDQYQIMHLSDKAGRFLRFAPGEPSLDLTKAVLPELQMDVRSALAQALHSGGRVDVEANYTRDGHPMHMKVTAHPVPDALTGRPYLLVMFDERPAPGDAAPVGVADPSRPEQLQSELAQARQQLRDSVEQYETQTEELKAGNEELQAINEELRATTEELETSREELQSMNEELATVNQELKSRIEQVNLANNDLHNFIASTGMGVLFVDRKLRLMRFTPPVREIFNVLDSDVGRSLLDITHRLDYPELEADLSSVLSTLHGVEREARSQSGRRYLARMLPYRTIEDRIEGVVATFVDVTSRRASEEQVRRGEEWMRFVVDSVRDYAIITFDTEGRVNSWNTGAQRVFGYEPAEILGRSADILFTPEDRASGAAQDEQRRAREDGRAADERWHLRKDGTRFYCSGVMVPLTDGEFYGYVKVARDLTDQELSVSERERLLTQERLGRAEVEELNRQKDQFLAMLSHELRNPLNLILMQAQLLLRTDPFTDAKSRHTAEVIYQTAATQSRLVDDLLDMSRVMTGKLAIQQHLVPLPFIVGDSIGAIARDAEQKGVQIDIDLTPEPLIVQADPVRVRQIAWNLLSNAIKFTPAGGRVQISLKRDGKDARLEVIDTGMGITPEALPHIFELFGQADQNLTRPQGGMGIGLALVRQLVDLHGGRIEVRSEGRDRGATFVVWLPLYLPPQLVSRTPVTPDGPPQAVTTPAPPDREAASPPLRGLRVLVVDDGEDAANALHELLEIEGADVEVALTGDAALVLARKKRFDVVVSDIAMPGMDGMALVRKLRAMPEHRKVVAIACSGFNRPQDVQRALEAGFDAHLSKPIGVRELVETALRLLHPPA